MSLWSLYSTSFQGLHYISFIVIPFHIFISFSSHHLVMYHLGSLSMDPIHLGFFFLIIHSNFYSGFSFLTPPSPLLHLHALSLSPSLPLLVALGSQTPPTRPLRPEERGLQRPYIPMLLLPATTLLLLPSG